MSTIRNSALTLAAFAVVTLFGTSAGVAREYPWCFHYPDYIGGLNCGFDTYEQCMASRSGIGGYCERNYDYYGDRKQPRRRHYRRD
jgi:Protein of unknown function (DUF3551)